MKITVLSVTLRGIAHLLKSEPVSKWAQKVLLAGIAPTPQESISSEEGQMGIRAEDVNLSHLGLQRVSYNPKGILTEAIQVTPENVGKLALEFEVELFYSNDGLPYIFVKLARGDGELGMRIRTADWIVPLRGEIHIFRDNEFQTTFELETFESPDLREADEDFMNIPVSHSQIRGEIFGDKTDDNSFIGKPGAWLTQNPESNKS